MKYTVGITETLYKKIQVEAATESEAVQTAHDKYNSSDIVLDWSDFIGVNIEIEREIKNNG